LLHAHPPGSTSSERPRAAVTVTELVDRLLPQLLKSAERRQHALPSEHAIARQYGVSRTTVRKAYERLQDMGIITAKQGKGSYLQVKQQKIPLLFNGESSFTEKMLGLSVHFYTEPLEYGTLENNVDSTNGEREKLFKFVRRRWIEGVPAALHISYIRLQLFPTIEVDGPKIQSIFAYYRHHGITAFGSLESNLDIRFPTPHERFLLSVQPLTPLLEVKTGTTDQTTNQVLEYTQIIYRSDLFTYVL